MSARAPSRRAAAPSLRLPPTRILVAGLIALIGIVLAVLAFRPKSGNLLVAAAGPNDEPIGSANVLFDQEKVCDSVPCRIDSLPVGAHVVQVMAPGYRRSAGEPVMIEAGKDALVNLTLRPEKAAGLEVRPNAQGLRVEVDGKDYGPTPTRVNDLSPGEHTVRLTGSSFYAPYEQKVTLERDRLLTWAPSLTPLKALIVIETGSGADGAAVSVIDASGGRERVARLPASLEVAPSGSYRVHAVRTGYQDFDREVSFADGVTKQIVTVELSPEETASSGHASRASSGGTLTLNSIPASSVLIDGKPLGKTPRTVRTSAGRHSIIFVHPKLGRRSRSVTVKTGKTVVASVRF